MTKKAILMIAVMILAVGFWIAAKPWVASPLRLSIDSKVWVWPLVLLVVLAAVEGLAMLIIQDKRLKFGMIALSGLPYLAVFGADKYYLVAYAILLALSWSSVTNIREEASERIKINIKQIMRRGLPNLITAILIMISFAYFLSPSTQASARKQQLPDSVRQIVAKSVETFAGGQLRQIPPGERQSFLNQATNEVMSQFTTFLKPYFKYLPPILAFGLFLVLQGLAFIFVWLAILAAILIFEILKKFGTIQIRVAQKEAEELEF